MKKLILMFSVLSFLCGCGGGNQAQKISVSLSPSAQTSIDQGQALNFTAQVTNDTSGAGVTWSMSGTSCSGTACGTFSNKTTTSATYNAPTSVSASMTVTILATSVTNTTKSASSNVVVSPAPSITTTSLASGTVGTAYSATLQASGGAGTLTWSLASGSSLPAGLSLSSSGAISGTPTTPATTSFTVKLTDSSGAQAGALSATQQLSLTIKPAPLTITSISLSNGVVGAAYSAALAASGGTGTISWSVTTGSLPGGLNLSGAGEISGTPTAAGATSFTVTATDSGTPPQTVNQSLSITINPKLAITTTALPNGVVSTPYSASLQSSGGVGTITWSVASGTLPAGLSMNGAGAISGTPTTAGASSFTVLAKDSGTPQQAVQQAFNITIYTGLTITTSSLPNGTVNSAYSATLQSAGGTGTITWSLAQGSLPLGLNLSGTGAITGLPTTAGTSSFTVAATDSSTPPQTKTQGLSITVNPVLSITTTSLPSGTVGTAYSQNILTNGGTLPITWSVPANTLPPGLTLQGNASGAGVVSGTPTAYGSYTFTVTATDSSSPQQSVNQQLTIVINNPPLTIITTSLPAGVVNTLYSEPLQASGGTPPYTWSVASGSSLPSWLSISGSGTSWTISGTPTATATVSFTLTVTDSTLPTHQSVNEAFSFAINAAAACTDSGSESLLNGQYAFILSGYTAESSFLAAVGSFTADGTGKITAGVVDSNGALVQSGASIDPTQSSYSVGSNHLGCATIVTSSGTFTTKLSVGGITSGVATAGRMVEWDNATNINYLTAVGQILKQTVPTNLPSGSYVYQQTGVYGSSNQYRTGVAGAITTAAGTSGGTITGGEYDVNVEGVINDGNGLSTPYSGMTGTYTAPDPTTGRFTVATTLNSATSNHVAYLVSGSQFLQMSTDALASDTGVLVGMGQLQSGSLSLTTGSNLVYYATGTETAELGLINVTGSTSYTANYYEDVGGSAESPQTPSCTYSIDTNGRVVTSGATCTMYLTTYKTMYPPVFYLTGPNTGVMLGTGAGVYVGQVEPQVAPSGGFSDTSISGTFYDGDSEVVNESVSAEMIDVEVLTFNGSGGVDIIGDYIGAYIGTSVTQDADQSTNTSLGTVNSNGTFSTNSTYGQINAIMISTTKAVDIDNATQPYPIITLVKQ
jgi:hypothetical protein